jgi:hypothetical protein
MSHIECTSCLFEEFQRSNPGDCNANRCITCNAHCSSPIWSVIAVLFSVGYILNVAYILKTRKLVVVERKRLPPKKHRMFRIFGYNIRFESYVFDRENNRRTR